MKIQVLFVSIIFYTVSLVHAQEIDKKEAMELSKKAESYVYNDNYDEALNSINKAIKLDSSVAAYYYQKAGLLSALEKFDEALINCNKAIELDSTESMYYFERGILLGNSIEALDDFTKAIELGYGQLAYDNRAGIYWALGRYEEAIEEKTTIIELYPYYHNYVSRARSYIKLGKYLEAIADYTSAIEKGYDYYSERAELYLIVGERDYAINDYTKLIELKPKYAYYNYRNRAKVYADKQLYEKAINDYSKAIGLRPESYNSYYERGFYYKKIGKLDEAEQDFASAVEKSANSSFNSKAWVKCFAGDLSGALENVNLALTKNRRDGILDTRATVYGLSEKFYKAIGDLNEAIEIKPKALYYYKRGLLNLTLNNLSSANNDFEKAKELEPSEAYINAIDPLIFYLQDNLDFIKMDLSKNELIRKDSISESYLVNYEKAHLGLINRQFQELDRYIKVFKESVVAFKEYNLWAKYFEALCNLSECYARKGMLDETKDYSIQIIEESKKQFGEVNSFIGNAYHNLGLAFQNNNEIDSSLIYYNKGLKSHIKFYGEKHKEVAKVYNSIGIGYYYKGDFDRALLFFQKALSIRIVLLGEYSFDVAGSYTNIGLIYHNKKDYKTALKYYKDALNIKEKVIGEYHTETADSYHNIGLLLYEMGDYKGSIEYHQKALEIRKNILDDENMNIAHTHYNLGNAYWKSGNLDSAIEHYKCDIKTREKINGNYNDEVAVRYSMIGMLYWDKKDFHQAIEFIQKDFEITKHIYGEINIDVANSYKNLGVLNDIIGNNILALEMLKKSAKILNAFDKQAEVASIYDKVGKIYYKIENYDESLKYFSKTLQIRNKIDGEYCNEIAECYKNIGAIYANQNRNDLAIENILKAIEIKEKIYGEGSYKLIDSYNTLGNIYRNKNEYDLAIKFSLKALKGAEYIYGKKSENISLVYGNLGVLYTEISKFDLALEYQIKALNIKKEIYKAENTSLAESYFNIGLIYDYRSEYELALEYYQEALRIFNNLLGDTSIKVANCYNNIGFICFKDRSNSLALENFTKSLEIFSNIYGEESFEVGGILAHIGNIYNNDNSYEDALSYYSKALKIFKKYYGENHSTIAGIYQNIGLIYSKKKLYKSAMEKFLKAGEILHKIYNYNHSSIAENYIKIGSLLYKMNETNKSLLFYQKALTSSVYDFNDSTDIYKIPEIYDYNSWQVLLDALSLKANVLSLSKEKVDWKSALLHYKACDTVINQTRQSFISKTDKLALSEKASDIYKRALVLCIKLSDECDKDSSLIYKKWAFYFSEKNKSSILLEALAGSEAQRFAGIPDTLLFQEQDLRKQISKSRKAIADQKSDSIISLERKKLFQSNRKLDSLINEFEVNYSDYYDLKYNYKSASLEEVQELLNNETVILSYILDNDNIIILTIASKNIEIERKPIFKNFKDTIKYFRKGLLYPNSSRFAQFYSKYAYKLYVNIIPSRLSREIENLIIIPDADLCNIPFETLLTKNSIKEEWSELPYLIKDFNISYSYSANLYFKTHPKQENFPKNTDLNDWLAFAPVFEDKNTAGVTMRTRELLRKITENVDTSIGTRGTLITGEYITPLPGTKNEVQEIFKIFNNKNKKALVQINKNANEAYVKSCELGKYNVIHFATHGFVNTTKPELSGILLAQDNSLNEDGILYTGELYNMKLDASLTVLSACETGLGKIKKGEGLMGLSRALLYAGSKNIIVSLWKVSDKSTSDLMIEFYKDFLEEKELKQEISESLRNAKLKMINEGKYAHPFYWSPFILIGK